MILIFDLDKTVTKDCFKNNPLNLQRLQNIMKMAINDPSVKVYVVTARIMQYYLGKNCNNIQNVLHEIVSYDVPDEILDFFYKKNRHRPVYEWVFCNISKEELAKTASRFLSKEGYDPRKFDIGMQSGIHKMIQLNFIAQHEQIKDWSEMIFFDDAIDNMEAWKFFCTLNPSMYNMIFVGGDGKDVQFPSHDEWEWAINRSRIMS